MELNQKEGESKMEETKRETGRSEVEKVQKKLAIGQGEAEVR